VQRPWRPAPCCREGMRLLRLVAMGGTSFVFATASAAALSAASNPSPMPSAARILPLGDSLTLGVQGQGGGYRSPLGQALKGYGSAYNVGFVGGLYLAGDHSGYSGHTIGGILGAVKGARTMEINAPTHVLLLGGTNDFYFYPPLGADAPTALQRMDALLAFLVNRTEPPHIFLATVPPVLIQRCAVYSQGPCAPTISNNIASFNSQLPSLVAKWRQKGAQLTLANMSEAGFAEPDYWTAGTISVTSLWRLGSPKVTDIYLRFWQRVSLIIKRCRYTL
jgi:lysophospholipase L1-like esterase